MNESELFGVFGVLLVFKDKIYSFSKKYNLLFVFNNISHYVEDVKMLPNEPIDGKNLISRLHMWNDELVLVPNNAKCIYVLNKDEFKAIKLDRFVDSELENKFGNSFVINNFLYLFGHWAPVVLILDLSKGTVVFEYGVPESINTIRQGAKDAYFKGCYINHQTVLLPFVSGGYLFEFNIESFSANWTLIDKKDNGYSEISSYGECFVMPHRRGGGLTIVKDMKKIKTIYNDIDFYYVSRFIKYKSGFLVSFYDGALYYLNIENEECSLIYDVKSYGMSNTFGNAFYLIEKDRIEEVYITNLQKRQISFDLSELNGMIISCVNNNVLFSSILNEDRIISLRTFLGLL